MTRRDLLPILLMGLLPLYLALHVHRAREARLRAEAALAAITADQDDLRILAQRMRCRLGQIEPALGLLPPRWLGIFTAEEEARLEALGLVPCGPAPDPAWQPAVVEKPRARANPGPATSQPGRREGKDRSQ